MMELFKEDIEQPSPPLFKAPPFTIDETQTDLESGFNKKKAVTPFVENPIEAEDQKIE